MSEKVQAKANSPQSVKAAGGLLQRKCACGQHTVAGGECEGCEKKRLQRRAAGRSEQDEAPPVVHEVLAAPGEPLDAGARAFMEPRFGHDLSRVRVHTDAKAAESARAVNAVAFTVGDDLVFASGEYNPQSSAGRRLLAHELAHVIQQRGMQSAGVQHRLRVGSEADPAELEADAMAERSLSSDATTLRANQSRLNTSQSNRGATPTIRRRVSDKFGTIKKNLTYRLLDWAITEKEAREVLNILKALSDEDLKDTVAEMEKEKLVDRLYDNLSKEDIQNNQDELRRIKNYRVYTETKTVDGKKVTTTTTGACSPGQNREIDAAVKAALVWLDKGIAQLDAFLAKPNDASTKTAHDALDSYFKNTTPDVARFVRGHLNRLQADLKNLPKIFTIECHGDWDLTCGSAGAYVPGTDRERVIFCDSFFGGEGEASNYQIKSLVHELSHAQVGGTHITDRAYRRNRLLKQLTTEEALTNADSLALFIQQLGTGEAPASTAPKDTFEDCPAEWKPVLDKALARAERWNRDTQVSLAKMTPVRAAQEFSNDDTARVGGTTQKDIDAIRKAVDALAKDLKSAIDFECEPKGGGRCDRYQNYWYALGDFHICPSWMALDPDTQVVSLLAGLYGYKEDVGDYKRRWNYALFAQSRTKSAAPALRQILGSSAWTPDNLRIVFRPEEPSVPGQSTYVESGTSAERMSEDLPEYSVPPCHMADLPFKAAIDFYVDRRNASRPAPFTPPAVSVEFNYMTHTGPVTKAVSDPRADYSDYGYPLGIKFSREFAFTLNKNGPLHMNSS